MSVKNLECQLAKAQIGLYLSGEGLSPEAMDQLESHIESCPDCKLEVAERRRMLQAMLGAKLESRSAVVQSQDEDTPPRRPGTNRNRLIEQIQRAAIYQPAPEPAVAAPEFPKQAIPLKKGSNWKPIALSGLLALVLVAMSYLSNNPSSVLGEKVAESLPTTSSTAAAPIAPEVIEPESPSLLATEAETESVRIPDAQPPAPERAAREPGASTPAPRVSQQPVVVTRPAAPRPRQEAATQLRAEPQPKKISPTMTHPAPAPAEKEPPTNRIRIYDENGKPIEIKP